MSFGVLGIQFGWGLQLATLDPRADVVGATAGSFPSPWLVAPLAGLLAQLSMGPPKTRTAPPVPGWRRPAVFAGAILASLAVLASPASSALWMASGVLWILHATLSLAGDPFPSIGEAVRTMPRVVRHLALVQAASWLGLVWMGLSFAPAVATGVFGATSPDDPRVRDGVAWAGRCLSAAALVTVVVAFALPKLAARRGVPVAHAIAQLAGAAGLVSVAIVPSPTWLLLSMVGVGMAWASTLSLPAIMLANALPEGKAGLSLGLFPVFLVIPELLASLGLGWVMTRLLGSDHTTAVVAGGAFLALAALLVLRVPRAEA
jgi:maltose/moltooligosaccharide transporter